MWSPTKVIKFRYPFGPPNIKLGSLGQFCDSPQKCHIFLLNALYITMFKCLWMCAYLCSFLSAFQPWTVFMLAVCFASFDLWPCSLVLELLNVVPAISLNIYIWLASQAWGYYQLNIIWSSFCAKPCPFPHLTKAQWVFNLIQFIHMNGRFFICGQNIDDRMTICLLSWSFTRSNKKSQFTQWYAVSKKIMWLHLAFH